MAPTTVSSLQLGSGVQLASRDFFKAKSNFIKKPISSAGVDIAARALSAASTRNIGGWMQFHAYGGALNQIKAADTAFVHRDKLASIQFYVSRFSAHLGCDLRTCPWGVRTKGESGGGSSVCKAKISASNCNFKTFDALCNSGGID